jgi:hypothetical protein
MKPLQLLGTNKRLEALLDMGISPGEDDSYEVQAQKLLRQKDQLVNNTKRNAFDRLESLIQTARQDSPPEGPLSPLNFATQTLAKIIPAPSEFTPDNSIKAVQEIAKHPIASLKQAVLNGPPDPTTVAAFLLPGAALKAYREFTPLAARTYIHHMAGVPTPFSHVTETERAALTQMAQDRIDQLLRTQHAMDTAKSHALQQVNKIKLMNDEQLLQFGRDENMFNNNIYVDKDYSERHIRNIPTDELRELIIKKYKRDRLSVFRDAMNEKTFDLSSVDKADRENVAEEYRRITGRPIQSFGVHSDEFSTALGKTFVEPMVDKATGRIVPKSIKDTYKFYPDVYQYAKGHGRNILKKLWGHEDWESPNLLDRIYENLKMSLSTSSNAPLGIWARKLGMRRPTSIIDIPLTKPPPMNAYDKAAILLGAKSLASKKE